MKNLLLATLTFAALNVSAAASKAVLSPTQMFDCALNDLKIKLIVSAESIYVKDTYYVTELNISSPQGTLNSKNLRLKLDYDFEKDGFIGATMSRFEFPAEVIGQFGIESMLIGYRHLRQSVAFLDDKVTKDKMLLCHFGRFD